MIKFQIKDIKYLWQKKHLENQSGTSNSFKPIKIRKMILKKNMILGNRLYLILILYFFYLNFSIAEEKIITSPLINRRRNKTKL